MNNHHLLLIGQILCVSSNEKMRHQWQICRCSKHTQACGNTHIYIWNQHTLTALSPRISSFFISSVITMSCGARKTWIERYYTTNRPLDISRWDLCWITDSVTCLDWYQFHQKNYIENCAETKTDFSADMCDKNHQEPRNYSNLLKYLQ